MRSVSPLALAILMAATPCVLAPSARALDKLSCIGAHEAAQEFRKRSQIASSREQLLLCSDPTCPFLVTEDCRTWLAEIDSQPEPITPSPCKATSPISPTPPRPAQGQAQVHAPGVANEVTGDTEAKAAPLRHARPALASHPPLRLERAQPHSRTENLGPTLLPGTLAVAALASAAYFGVRGLSQADRLSHTCSPDCDPADVLSARRQLVIADLSLLAGVGLGTLTGWMIWKEHKQAAMGSGSSSGEQRLGSVQGAGAGWSAVPGLSSLRVQYGGRF